MIAKRRTIAAMQRAFLIAAMMFCADLACARLGPAPLPGLDGVITLGRHIERMEDAQADLTLQDVLRPEHQARFTRPEVETPNFGYTRSAWWLRFRLAAADDADRERLLEIRFPSIDRLEFYLPQPGGWRELRAGDTLPWDAREVKHRNHVMRFTLPAGQVEQDYYLRISSAGVLTAPLYLWRPEAFERSNYHTQLLVGLFYGLIAAMVLYNLMLYFTVRDRSYLYYVAYTIAFGTFLLAFDGLAFEYLWPESVWWANHGLATALALTLAFGTLFSGHFLDMKRIAPRAYRAMQAAAVSGAALAFCAATGWLLEYGQILRAISVIGFATAALAITVAVQEVVLGFKPARYFLLAWGVLLVFIALGALRNFALVPTNFLTINGLHIGFAFDVLFLSFALADRITILKRDATLAQAAALANHRALLDATQANERELERRIAERTVELNRANDLLRGQEEHLRHLAQHDPLTGLPNRTSMQQRLALALEITKRNRKKLAVMLVDLNDFKRLNDSRGHVVGDHALVAIAARLRTSVRGSDTVARYGGDEFVVLAGELDRAEDAGSIAEKISDMVSVPLPVEGVTEKVGCSIGISIYPDDASSAGELIEHADHAMYRAKAAKRGRYAFFAA